jgi:hypothetical protein
MLQVFYLDVTKVDQDVAYTCMLQTYVFKCFQVFLTYVCKCVIWMLHMFGMVLKCFFRVFTSVSHACFKCSIYLILHVSTIASGCFKKIGCYTWNACEKWLAARATFRAAWATSGAVRATSRAVRAHCWCARSRAQRVLALARSLCGTFRTLAPRLDVRALASPFWKTYFSLTLSICVLNVPGMLGIKLGAMPAEEAMQEYITIVQELFPTGIQVQVR